MYPGYWDKCDKLGGSKDTCCWICCRGFKVRSSIWAQGHLFQWWHLIDSKWYRWPLQDYVHSGRDRIKLEFRIWDLVLISFARVRVSAWRCISKLQEAWSMTREESPSKLRERGSSEGWRIHKGGYYLALNQLLEVSRSDWRFENQVYSLKLLHHNPSWTNRYW